MGGVVGRDFNTTCLGLGGVLENSWDTTEVPHAAAGSLEKRN